MEVKIYKVTRERFIMDVTESLRYHEWNREKTEKVYKGKLIFGVTERKQNKYASALIDKATAKMIFHEIINHNFPRLFPKGYVNRGIKEKERIFTIRLFKTKKGEIRYEFTFEIVNGDYRNEIKVDISYVETLKMAHEVLDYIKIVEEKAYDDGEPLHTIKRKIEEEENAVYMSNNNTSKEGLTQKEEEQKDKNTKPYTIPYGRLKGKRMEDLTDEHIQFIIKQDPKDPVAEELKNYARIECEKRGLIAT